jgi:micrococcal nuclease
VTGQSRTYPAVLVRVVDGDTVDLDVDLGFRVHGRLRFRLKDINCPERGRPGWAEATDYTRSWFADRGGQCRIESFKDAADVYSRWVAVVADPIGFVDGAPSLNDSLVSAGHAVSDVYPWRRP